MLPRRPKTATRRAPRRRPCAMPIGCLQGGGGLLRGADGRTVGFVVGHNDLNSASDPQQLRPQAGEELGVSLFLPQNRKGGSCIRGLLWRIKRSQMERPSRHSILLSSEDRERKGGKEKMCLPKLR